MPPDTTTSACTVVGIKDTTITAAAIIAINFFFIFIVILLSEPETPMRIALCVGYGWEEPVLHATKQNRPAEALRFNFVVQNIETTGDKHQSTQLLSPFHNENIVEIDRFGDLLIC